MSWLGANSFASPRGFRRRLDIAAIYTSAHCLLTIFPEILAASTNTRGKCINGLQHHPIGWKRSPVNVLPADLSWQTSRLAFEFHDSTREVYWRDIDPKLPALRRLYATHGGVVTTVTLLRDPMQHIFSAWAYLPPLTNDRLRISLSFADWAHKHASGLQAGWLQGCLRPRYCPNQSRHHPQCGYHNQAGGAAVLNMSLRNLARFDVVGVLSCLPSLYRAIESHARLAPIDDDESFRRRMHAPNRKLIHVRTETARRLRNVTHASVVLPAIRNNQTAWRIVASAVQHDALLFEAAKARALKLTADGAQYGCPIAKRSKLAK